MDTIKRTANIQNPRKSTCHKYGKKGTHFYETEKNFGIYFTMLPIPDAFKRMLRFQSKQ